MSRLLKFILFANLALLTALVFIYPHLMVGPGKLISGHKALNTDCFACHAAFRGVQSERCTTCHKAADIGVLTTTGAPVLKPMTATPFHQKLTRQECISCHSDHAGVKRFAKLGHFNHGLLQQDIRDQCETCHKSPKDSLHQQISGNCGQCHNQDKWVPATFDHDKYFRLDRDHSTRCATCHARNDYTAYTCYGCHEHTPDNIRRKHIEEGIRNYENCVKCHRSPDEKGDDD